VKDELPRIRYANQALQIEVDKLTPSNPQYKTQEPFILLEFTNAPPQTLYLSHKWSTQIVTDLMATAGLPSIWPQWVEERKNRGENIYVDRYGNGRGQEEYVRQERVWKIGRVRPPRQKGEVAAGKMASLEKNKLQVGEVKSEEKGEKQDVLKGLLGLELTESGPTQTSIPATLP